MVLLKIKWGGKWLDVDVDPNQPVELFKAQLQSLTGVPSSRQKLTGFKGGVLADDADLSTMGLKEGQKVMLVGTAEVLPDAPKEKAKFLEDLTVEEKAKEYLPSGLTNMGNTCYLNATLQTIRVIPQLREALASFRPQDNGKEAQTTIALRELLRQMDNTPEAVTPQIFVTLFRVNYPQFAQTQEGHYMQQDAEECWTQLMSACAMSTSSSGGSSNPVDDLFGGATSVTFKCAETDVEPEQQSEERFRRLQCHISSQSTSLENGLQEGMNEKLTKASPALGRDAVYLKSSKLQTLPEFLCVQLVRFFYRTDTKTKTKIVRPLSFPMVLDAFMLCSDSLKKSLDKGRVLMSKKRDIETELRKHTKKHKGHDHPPASGSSAMEVDEAVKPKEGSSSSGGVEVAVDPAVAKLQEELSQNAAERAEYFQQPERRVGNSTGWYELCAVISHKGRSADGGHYVAWVKHRGDWLLFDDNKVDIVREDKVKATQGGAADDHLAYMLLYRTRSSEGNVCGPP
eukprot:RCo012737